ncbi:MAG: hypothetical protein IT307_11610 [Chloroflexi bacterium]|nr:hypothetical protein [Chloroflexota bacterium]
MTERPDATTPDALVARLAGRQVAVVGDLLLDEYLVGRPTRISREAPVMILEFARQFYRPGGAANPATNIRALGSWATVIGVTGDDSLADCLLAELQAAGLESRCIVRREQSATPLKTRILAEDGASRQHIVRFDRSAPPPDAETRQHLVASLREAAQQADAVLLSDYRAGAIAEEVVVAARELAERGMLVTVDSQGSLDAFAGLSLLKCNLAEAERCVGRSLPDEASVEAAGVEIMRRLQPRHLVITRGLQGLSAFEPDRPVVHLPATNRTEVFDVTGAGDTVIAVLTLALVAGCSLVEAARLANAAAGIVVRRLGVATVTPEELTTALET